MGCGASKSSVVLYANASSDAWNEVVRSIQVTGKGGVQNELVVCNRWWKTVRIFVSSTFLDFYAEREALVKRVFPDLSNWCQKRRLHLVECDLRWGVPKESTSETTVRTCLSEIDRCKTDNIMPFFLNMTSERCGWIPQQSEVSASLVDQYQWVFGLSLTEMEIVHGAYRLDNPNALYLIRDKSFLKTIPTENRKDFVDENALEKMETLKQKLHERFKESHIKSYTCKYDGVDPETNKVKLKGLDNFCKIVYDFFRERIGKQYPLDDTPVDPYQQQKDAHEAFMTLRGTLVLGRDEILNQIEEYITSAAVNAPLLLLGGAGMGKSAIMARVSSQIYMKVQAHKIPGAGSKGWHLFYHFIGATPNSTDTEIMLKRLLKEIRAVNDENMPSDYDTIVQTVHSALSNTNTTPVIILIDALNQLDEEKNKLNWIPTKLAPQIRMVLSMIDNSEPHKSFRHQKTKVKELLVTPLDTKARKDIVCERLQQYNKQLDENQMNNLLSKLSSENPLWLSIACEELRVYGLFEQLDDKINELRDGLIELFEYNVLARFEKEHGGHLLKATLCLLETSTNGLLENELLSLLAHESIVNSRDLERSDKDNFNEKDPRQYGRLPAARWAEVFRALKPFLRPFGDCNEGRLDFYHRSLSKAVRKKYFYNPDDNEFDEDSDPVYVLWNRRLAKFFQYEPNLDRKIEEYPNHLSRIKDKKRLTAFLLDWDVVDKLYHYEYSSKLLYYWGKTGDLKRMVSLYKEQLEDLEKNNKSKDTIVLRYIKVGRIFMQASQNEPAKEILEKAMSRQMALGDDPERMVEIYATLAEIWQDIVKLKYEFISSGQLVELKPAIEYGRKAYAIRKTMTGDMAKFKTGVCLLKMAFDLHNWNRAGGDADFDSVSALNEAKTYVNLALQIFKDLKDGGHLAEAYMTQALVMPDGSLEQKKYYEDAMSACLQSYGEYHILTGRISCNYGIYFEGLGQYTESYKLFKRFYEINLEVLGAEHPKTTSAKNIINEETYVDVAQRLEAGADNDAEDDSDDDSALDDAEEGDRDNSDEDNSGIDSAHGSISDDNVDP